MPGQHAPDGSRRRRGAAGLVAVLLATVVLAGCGRNFGAPDSATEQGDHMLTVWRVFFVGALAVALLIWGLVMWSVLRYRRRPSTADEPPPQRQYHVALEVAYTIIPLVAVGLLFALTVVATDRITSTSATPDVTIEVHGFQWQWRFVYEGRDVTVNGTTDTPPTLVLPVGETVELDLVADDVIHSFWVPDFLEKRDLIPGQDNRIQVEVTAPGEWVGRCAEFCGLNHWLMSFQVRAVPPAEFQAWLDQAADQPQPLVAGAPS